MKLLRPIKYTFPTDKLYTYAFAPFEVKEELSGDGLGRAMQILFERDIDGNIIQEKLLNKFPYNLYFGTQNKINVCINNAETIYARLGLILENLIAYPLINKTLLGLDFMKLRDLFSDFIKTYVPIKKVVEYDTVEKLSILTSLLHDMIIDRNIYTHGRLLLHVSEMKVVIQYINKGERQYCEVNAEILKSYNDAYDKIMKLLDSLEQINAYTPDNASINSLFKATGTANKKKFLLQKLKPKN